MFHVIMGWDHAWPELLEAFTVGYVIGSIPFGILIARLFALGDLRQIGSGNIGATNVLRTGNKAAAALTLLLDMVKGLAPTLYFLTSEGDLAAQATGIGAVLGHCLPVWLKFRGGKGVATFLGVILGLSFYAGLAACATWLAITAALRISSASALAAAALSPLWLWMIDGPRAVLCGIGLAIWIWIRHHENILRLLKGEEPRIGKKS